MLRHFSPITQSHSSGIYTSASKDSKTVNASSSISSSASYSHLSSTTKAHRESFGMTLESMKDLSLAESYRRIINNTQLIFSYNGYTPPTDLVNNFVSLRQAQVQEYNNTESTAISLSNLQIRVSEGFFALNTWFMNHPSIHQARESHFFKLLNQEYVVTSENEKQIKKLTQLYMQIEDFQRMNYIDGTYTQSDAYRTLHEDVKGIKNELEMFSYESLKKHTMNLIINKYVLQYQLLHNEDIRLTDKDVLELHQLHFNNFELMNHLDTLAKLRVALTHSAISPVYHKVISATQADEQLMTLETGINTFYFEKFISLRCQHQLESQIKLLKEKYSSINEKYFPITLIKQLCYYIEKQKFHPVYEKIIQDLNTIIKECLENLQALKHDIEIDWIDTTKEQLTSPISISSADESTISSSLAQH